MTYGWAILGAMLAIGVLAYMGFASSSKSTQNRCVFETGINCVGVALNSTSGKFVLQNSIGTLYNVNVNVSQYTVAGSVACVVGSSTYWLQDNLNTINCTWPWNLKNSAKVKVIVTYQKNSGGYPFTSIGDVYYKITG